MLRAHVGSATVFARTGERRLWLLDATSTALWDLLEAGAARKHIAGAIAQLFGLTPEAAEDHLDQLDESWRAAGLLRSDGSAAPDVHDPFEPLPRFATPSPLTAWPPAPDSWPLTVADRTVVVGVDDSDLRAIVEPLLKPLQRSDVSGSNPMPDRMRLVGDESSWKVMINGAEIDCGHGWEAALVSTLSALTDLGSRTQERLLVAHGAGLIAPDGRCLVMFGPGGSGKSTLAVALEADGFQLLSDDVVPIGSDGAAMGLGLPTCIKRGSWQILATVRPDLEQSIEVLRLGRTVRLLPIARPVSQAAVPSFLLFPRYEPDAPPRCTPLLPEQALQRIIEAETVIRDLTQEKLEMLCRWVGDIPSYALGFQDLKTGTRQIRDIIESRSPRSAEG